MLTKSHCWQVEDYMGQNWIVQFWETGKYDRFGKIKLCFAVFVGSGDAMKYVWRGWDYWPGYGRSSADPECAIEILQFMEYFKNIEIAIDDDCQVKEI